MTAIDYLHVRGFSARKVGMRVRVSPASRLTDDIRRYVKSHRLELLAELVADDGRERRVFWHIICGGESLCVMIGEPMTYAEALETARSHWPDADVCP
jgi:hypothetical protein